MQTFKIPVTWLMSGIVEVEAESLLEGQQMALNGELPIGNYVEDSIRLDEVEDLEEE